MKKQFLLLAGNYPPEAGGPSKFVDSFSQWLTLNGFSVAVVSTTPNSSYSFDNQGVHIQLVSRKLPLVIRYLRTAYWVIRLSNRDSIILANGSLLEALIVRIVGSRRYFVKLPGDVVWEQARAKEFTELNMLDFQKIRLPFSLFFLRILSTCALKLSSKVLVPSSVMYSVCLNWGINQSSLVKVYNSVNLSRFRPQGLPKKFDLISVSRLISIKGIEEVIKTAKELDFSLLIVGEGPSLHQLKTLADKLEGRVTFFGSATQVQLPELYEASGVFILNSEFEAGTPYSLLEARASGLICIGRENTGCEDVITNGVDGFLCGPKSGLDLKAALQQVKALSNRKMQEFGLTAISDTSVRFSQESIFRTILKEIS